MFCEKCGKEIPEGKTCDCQNTVIVNEWQGNSKLFSILSYISILWLLGLLISPEKNDPRVKFHVGQGIMLSIVTGALNIIAGIIGGVLTAISGWLALFMWPVNLAITGAWVFLMVKGIVNVCNGKEEQLPVIGQYAFVK